MNGNWSCSTKKIFFDFSDAWNENMISSYNCTTWELWFCVVNELYMFSYTKEILTLNRAYIWGNVVNDSHLLWSPGHLWISRYWDVYTDINCGSFSLTQNVEKDLQRSKALSWTVVNAWSGMLNNLPVAPSFVNSIKVRMTVSRIVAVCFLVVVAPSSVAVTVLDTAFSEKLVTETLALPSFRTE